MPLRVSVVLAVRNGERYLYEAIDSVLNEGVDELIVVDDGSTDRTAVMLDGYGDAIVRLRQEPAGQAVALNRGVLHSSGDIIGFQDADDVWVGGRQTALLAALFPECDAVYGAVEQFVSPDLDPQEARKLSVPAVPQPSQLLTTMLVRRSAFDTVGLFDGALQSAHNIDWTSRARFVPLQFATVPDVVARRRIHLSNSGRVRAAENRIDLTRVMRAHLDRKRTR